MSGKDLPITGGLAAVCAFAVLLIKLIKGDADLVWFRVQVLLLGLGATLYIVPYMLGVQVTQIGTDTSNQLASILVSSQNPDVALPLCYLSGALVGVIAAIAVIYNLRQASGPRAERLEQGADPMSADDLATALTSGGAGWLVLSLAAVLPILWAFAMIMHFARPYVIRFLAVAHPALRRRRLVAVVRAHPRRAPDDRPRAERRLPHAQPVHRARPAAHGAAGDGGPAAGRWWSS